MYRLFFFFVEIGAAVHGATPSQNSNTPTSDMHTGPRERYSTHNTPRCLECSCGAAYGDGSLLYNCRVPATNVGWRPQQLPTLVCSPPHTLLASSTRGLQRELNSGRSCCCSPEAPFYALFNHVWVACGDDLLLLSGRTLQSGLAAHKSPTSGGCDQLHVLTVTGSVCHTYRSTAKGRVASYCREAVICSVHALQTGVGTTASLEIRKVGRRLFFSATTMSVFVLTPQVAFVHTTSTA